MAPTPSRACSSSSDRHSTYIQIITFKMASIFYVNQVAAGDEIVEHFRIGSYALLWALCQSGKTGAFHYVAKQMLAERLVKRVYILCGSAEVCLRDQAKEEALKYNAEACASGILKVFFRTAFHTASLVVEDSLIIVEESHLDSTKGQQLDGFLKDHGLSLTGSALPRGCRILSVSATPFAEIAAMKAGTKKVVQLVPGPNYFGARDYLDMGRLQSTFPIQTDPKRFKAILKMPIFAGKWIVLRVKDAEAERAVRAICATLAIDIRDYTQKATTVAITRKEQLALIDEGWKRYSRHAAPKHGPAADAAKAAFRAEYVCLEDAPVKTTVVFLKDRLRAGKVVPKQHIGLVWEDAVSSNTDTVLQGLLGRMCGYIRDQAYKPFIFLPPDVLKSHPGCVVTASEIERGIAGPALLPMKAAHLVAGKRATAPSHTKTQCVPIRLTVVPDDSDAETKSRCFQALQTYRIAHPATFSSLFTDDQITEVDNYLALPLSPTRYRDIHIRHLAGGSQMSWFKSLQEAVATGTSLHGIEEISSPSKLTFAVVEKGYRGIGAIPGTVYAIFYTDSPSKSEVLNKKHTIGKTDGLDIFSPGPELPAAVGGAGSVPAAFLGFSKEGFSTPELFRKQLKEILSIPSSSSVYMSKVLSDPIKGHYSFQRSAFGYRSTADNELQTLCSSVGAELGLTITPKYKLTDRKDVFHVASLRWSVPKMVEAEDPQ